jgi:hypothetical protein
MAAIAAVVAMGLLIVPAAAQAYQVQINIRGAGQVTETTPANLVGSNCLSSAHTPTGTVGKTCFAGTVPGDYGWGWDVDYLATPSPGYTFVGWQPIAGFTGAGVLCDRSSPPATTTTYPGSACKFKTFDNLQTEAVFQDLTAPPPPTVSSSPAGPVNGPVSFSVYAPSDPTFQKYSCSLSGPGISTPSCNGNLANMNPAQSGTYTFSIQSVDYSGNVSSTVQRTFTVDKTPPETTLYSAVGPAPDVAVSSTSATFAFSSSESGTFHCSLDDAPQTCTGGQVTLTDLTQGHHVFKVWAVDGVGNADLTPAERSWTVDTVAPETSIGSGVGPAEGSTTLSTDAIFHLTSSEPGGFKCALDGQPQEGCDDPLVLSHLTVGSHQLRVWAVDSAGNLDATPAVRHWSVSTASGPAGPGDPGTPGSACETAKQKLAAAKQKLKKLKAADAPARKIKKAKKQVLNLKNAMGDACADA